MFFLRQSTAVTVPVGGFWDKTDGVTPESGLAGTMSVYLHKAGANPVARNSATAIAYPTNAGGHYNIHLDTTDTNTLGTFRVHITDSATHLGVWEDYMVMTASAWDALFGSGNLTVELSTAAVDAVLDDVVETTVTVRQALRLFLSALTGKTSGGGTGTVVFRDIGDTKNRISATIDGSNNRTAVGTRDGT